MTVGVHAHRTDLRLTVQKQSPNSSHSLIPPASKFNSPVVNIEALHAFSVSKAFRRSAVGRFESKFAALSYFRTRLVPSFTCLHVSLRKFML